MKILYNHLGYVATSEKTALVQAPEGSLPAAFALIDWASGEPVFSGTPQALGAVPGWRNRQYWAADFSAVQTCGNYYLRVQSGTAQCVTPPFAIAAQLYGAALRSNLLHYFKSQRCTGVFDLADRQCPVISNIGSNIGSSERVDVHGGWYDASGDTSKYLSHLSYSNFMNPQQTPQLVWNLLAARDALPPASLWENERLLDEALHGADFLHRMQHPEGYFYVTVFDRWSKDIAQRQICDYSTQQGHMHPTYQAGFRQGAGSAIAALARASRLPRHGEFGSADYLHAAERGFAHLQQHNRAYLNDGQENTIDDYTALLAATELFAATASAGYAEAAAARATRLLARQSQAGWFWANDAQTRSFFHAAEAGLPYIALLRYLQTFPQAQNAEPVRLGLVRGLQAEISLTGRGPGNPFGYPRQYVQMPGQPGRVQFFFPHQNESGYWWQGENARLASLAAAALWTAKLLDGDDGNGRNDANATWAAQLQPYAHDALHWIFGRNPFDACMMQGQGHNNPRYETGYFNAPGGVCNGITSGLEDEADIDFRMPHQTTPSHSWRWNEQWLLHGAWLFLALAQVESANNSP